MRKEGAVIMSDHDLRKGFVQRKRNGRIPLSPVRVCAN